MGKFIQSNLGRNESVILEAKFSIFGGLGIIGEELGFTNKNVIGKVGIIKRRTLTAPLNKVQGVKTGSGFFGKIFGYGYVEIASAADRVKFNYVKKPEAFKKAILDQIDIYEEQRIKQQASEMAGAMAGALKK